MADSVITSFNEFLRDKVNLDPGQTATARASKDWLIGQISSLAQNDEFPSLVRDFHLHYGSFARRTKTRPLDDIDIMIGIHAQESLHFGYSSTHAAIEVNPSATALVKLCNAGTYTLNSIKVINCFVSNLKNIHQYRKAEIKRNQVAAVLNLTSYDWNFDIVPCFRTKDDIYGQNRYLIPDGKGNWQFTDPRIDQQHVTTINKKHNGKVLNSIRIMKLWNKRQAVTKMPSYLIENMVLNYYANTNSISDYIDIEVPKLLDYIANAVYYTVDDPKGIQGNLNTLTLDERNKINAVAIKHSTAAKKAREYEQNGNQHMSVLYWYDVFGDDFPRWG